jgi:methylglutaconyl-CoA hydratase
MAHSEELAGGQILKEHRDSVLWLKINREERRNSINDEVIHAFTSAIVEAQQDDGVRAIVLTGVGRAFCSGADLSPKGGTLQFDFSQPSLPFAQLLTVAKNCNLPMIARVNGHCVAGGMGLLGMCDLAVSTADAKFGLPEVKVGLFPMLVTSVLQTILSPRHLNELALTGELISAQEALSIGLVNHVVPAEDLDAKVDWLLDRIISKSPTGIRRGKYALRHAASMTFEQSVAFLETQLGGMSMTEDAREGKAAFGEKRPPVFTGR